MLEEFQPVQEVQEEKVDKEELTETQNEPQNEYVDPQKEAKEQLANEEGFEFTQTLTKEDITEMNIFLVKHDSTAFVKRAFLTFVGVLFIVMSIINGDNYYMIALGSIVVIYALVLYNVLRVRYVRGRIDKFPPEPLEINVKIGSKYIKYQLTEETDSPLVAFSHVYKVYKNKDYLYLFINRYSIIVLKLNSIEQKEEVLKSIKDRYLPRKAYFEK
mgnify:CR=1 FL=1